MVIQWVDEGLGQLGGEVHILQGIQQGIEVLELGLGLGLGFGLGLGLGFGVGSRALPTLTTGSELEEEEYEEGEEDGILSLFVVTGG